VDTRRLRRAFLQPSLHWRSRHGCHLSGLALGLPITHTVSANTAYLSPYESPILDLAYDGIFLLSPSGRILFWNRGAVDMYGWTKDEAIGRISHELLKTSFPEPFDRIEQKLESDGRWEGELLHTTREQKQLLVSSRWALRRDPAGRPEAILEIVRDLTSQRQAERDNARLAAIVESSRTRLSVNRSMASWKRGTGERNDCTDIHGRRQSGRACRSCCPLTAPTKK
jgi:PAS domain S-box-containing protein